MANRKMDRKCPFHDNCFTCPMSDCKVDSTNAIRMNRTPYDKEQAAKHTRTNKKRAE